VKYLVLLAVLLSGCESGKPDVLGVVRSGGATFKVICVGEVQYMPLYGDLTVRYKPDGSVYTCY
jgi:hypothetical protein